MPSAAARSLRTAAERLLVRVSHWTPDRWILLMPDGGTRADAFHGLVQRLADLSAQVEGRPARPVPRLDNDLALPDQMRVMVADLVHAGDPATLTAADALITTFSPR